MKFEYSDRGVMLVSADRSSRVIGGSRNPFVLAELKTGKKIDWDAMRPHEVRQKLSEALNTPYEKLFSPQHNSPLYRKTLRFNREGRK